MTEDEITKNLEDDINKLDNLPLTHEEESVVIKIKKLISSAKYLQYKKPSAFEDTIEEIESIANEFAQREGENRLLRLIERLSQLLDMDERLYIEDLIYMRGRLQSFRGGNL